MPGARAPDVEDILRFDPDTLANMTLPQLRRVMERCGISTEGVETVGAAAMRLVERGAIEPGT